MSIGGSTTGRSINLEIGRSATATSSLGETALRDLAGVSSGAISISNFYGKSSLPDGCSDLIITVSKTNVTYSSNVNQTQDWLNTGSLTGNDSGDANRIFDGIDTRAGQGRPTNLKWTFNTPIVANESLSIRGSSEGANNVNWAINGTAVTERPANYTNNSTFPKIDITSISFPITISSIGPIKNLEKIEQIQSRIN